ncbi:MAG: GntR family transcriptional regulator [Candidatus Rokubacteria bacterium]|nr:GntR family transcriptional regulator [Candidatus Rokubacteria bacterium]MBI3826092.1 GntR family transcriptional regulator [Candidatus Rokubacteria bacterium]
MARSQPRPSLAEHVYASLRRALVEREFDPGEPLTEHELCRRFKVSRTPVREALKKLERDHLVRVVPKKGAFVQTLGHAEIRDLYQLREALEALAVRLAAPRIERADLEDFERRFRELRARGARLAYTDVRRLGEEFHLFLLKASGNGKLVQVLEEIREQIQSVWTMSILAPRRIQALVREHLAIVTALGRGESACAERLMGAHVRRVREAIFTLVD